MRDWQLQLSELRREREAKAKETAEHTAELTVKLGNAETECRALTKNFAPESRVRPRVSAEQLDHGGRYSIDCWQGQTVMA